MIYLDYASATPVDKEVLEVYNETSNKYYANPNSIHPLGIKSKEKLDDTIEVK